MLNVLVAILGLGLLILIHEAGHFFTALAVGMRPRRFYVGFPPALAKVERNGVEYGLGSIPLGGYVKIPGMHRPSASDVEAYFGRARDEAPRLCAGVEHVKRPLEKGDLDAARRAVPELETALAREELSPPAARAARRGLDELRDGLGPEAYWRQRLWKRIAVILAGPAANVVLGVLIFTVLLSALGGKETRTVASVQAGEPAATAPCVELSGGKCARGLQQGDEIFAVDFKPVSASQIRERIASSKGKPLTLLVTRDDRIVQIGPVRPRQQSGIYRLGFVPRGEGLSIPTAAWESVKLTGLIAREIGKTFGRLVKGEGREEVAGPVGIVDTSSHAVNQGLGIYAEVLAVISINLALLNLLPLLPLDGGHIAFSVIEGLRRRSVRREVYERVSAVGIALFVLIFFLALSNDISRLRGGG